MLNICCEMGIFVANLCDSLKMDREDFADKKRIVLKN